MLKDIIDTIGYSNIIETLNNNYKLEDGIYIKLDINKSIENIEILLINNKKDKEIENIELYNWFKNRDICSKNLNSNKAVVSGGNTMKVIISSNLYTVFFNVATILKNVEKQKTNINNYCELCIKDYYNALENKLVDKYEEMVKPFKQKKEKIQDVLNKYFINEMEEFSNKERKNILKTNMKYLIDNLEKIIETLKTQNKIKNSKVKIFFNESIERYKSEYELYFYPNVFVENKQNVVSNNVIKGLHNNNMGLNSSKKPYLSNRSCKIKIPSAVTIEESIELNNLYKYFNIVDKNLLLENDDNKLDVTLYSDKDTPITIVDYNNIPYNFDNKIRFNFRNVLQIKDIDGNVKDDSIDRIKEMWQLEKNFSELFFNGRMNGKYRYFNNDDCKHRKPLEAIKGEFTNRMQRILLINKNAIWSYFKNGIDKNFKFIASSLTNELLKENIKHVDLDLYKAKEMLNYKISLIEFLGGVKMGNRIEELINNCSKENFKITNDDEYYFMTGQVVYYLVSQSKAQDKTLELFRPFMQINNDKILKNKVKSLLKYYSHSINLGNIKFKNIVSQLSIYCSKTVKITAENEDMLLAGFLADNVFYKSENKKVVKDNKEDIKNENDK